MGKVGRVVTWPVRAPARRIRRARWYTKVVLVLVALAAAPLLFVAAVYLLPPDTAVALGKPVLAWLSDAPDLPTDLQPVTERSVLLAADGSELATLFGDVNRVEVGRAGVADVVVDALLASEDDQFYEHPGVDHRAVIRAAVVNLRAGGVEQGGSTLTQQLVKNVYLDPSRTVRRKLTEAWYALELEDRLTKDEILVRYLNEAFFGQGAYGIEAAAQLYFDRSARELDTGQAALLIGIIPSPSRLNPVDDPAAARQARDRVLDRMVAVDRLSEAEAAALKDQDLALDIAPPPPPAEPFFVAYVRKLLLDDPRFDDALGTDPVRRERLVYGGGLRIFTTLEPRLQDAANAAVRDVMDAPATSPVATLVTVEPDTGAVRAMAVGPHGFGRCDEGVRDCPRTMVNPAVPGLGGSGRQPGSAFKPFVLAAALDADFPPGWEQRTADAVAIPGCDDDGEPYRPSNYSTDPGVKDMREALGGSNNVYHARLAGTLGPEALIEAAEAAGLRGGVLPEECSVALGSGSAYPLAMASAYATFANGGVGCEPMAVTRIERGALAGGGERTYEPTCEQRVSEQVAVQMTALLQAPVEGGTATAAQLDRPVAGKTGTTDDYRDAWFVGYVPQLATATWIGYEQPRPLLDVAGVSRVTGGTVPAQLWAHYMQVAVQDLDNSAFPAPPPPEVETVPDFRRRAASAVRETYAEDHTFNVETRRVRHHRPAGTVVRHRPAPGERVAAGALLTLYVSDGKGPAPRIPNVIGSTEARARTVLGRAGYRVEVRPRPGPPARTGRVTETDPPPGTRLPTGEVVTIVVVRDGAQPTEEPSEDEPVAPESPGPDPGPEPRPTSRPPGPRPRPSELPEPTESPAPPRSRQVKFARIVAAPSGNDLAYNSGEYVTIASGRFPVDVSGWTIQYRGGGTLRIGSGYRMGAGATLDVHTGSGDNDPPEVFFNGLSREVLEDEGGVLILRDAQGREVSRREY